MKNGKILPKSVKKYQFKFQVNLKSFFIWLLVAGVILSFFISFPTKSIPTGEEIPLSQALAEIKDNKIKEVKVEEDKLILISRDEKTFFSRKETQTSFTDILKTAEINPATVNLTIKDVSLSKIWMNILGGILPIALMVLFFFFIFRQARGAQDSIFSFGRSKAQLFAKGKQAITFKDVAGVDEAKKELQEVVDFLKHPGKYRKLGARTPKGVLLVGPSGTGKTLLAKAVAGEANVSFFSMAGSEFMEMLVGVGASRVRDLFSNAKKAAPSIIFIDEIDAIGRQRGLGFTGGHDEREQTLNQILVELDGFESNSGLVVMSATNRPDILDPALLRPGRFDRKIILDLPDLKDREEILKIHSRNKPLASNVNLKRIAERTPGFSGADLENLLNEAALLAAKRNKLKINNTEIIESVERVLLGPERKSHILSEKEKKVVAYHEAGHAVIGYSLPGCDPIQKVSIIARGLAAGYTLQMPTEDKYLRNKSEFMDQLTSLLGGYASEEKVFSQVTTGAADDLHKATQLARRLVTEFGMSAELGPRTFGEKEELIFLGREIAEHRDYSEKTAQTIDEEVSKIINLCYNKAKSILEANRTKLDKISDLLLKKETLEKEEFEKAMEETA